MRGGTHAFLTHEKNRRDRMNLVWHPLRGKPGVLGDWSSDTDGTQVISDPDMMQSGVNITSAATASVEAGVLLTSAGADSDTVILEPHSLANNSMWNLMTWGTDQEVEWEAVVAYATVFAQRTWKAGLALDPTAVTVSGDADQIGFMASADGAIDVIVSIGANDTIVAGVQTVLVGQYLHLAIKIDAGSYARCFIDGREVGGATNAYFLGNSAELFPYGGALLELTNPTSPLINCMGMACSRALGA